MVINVLPLPADNIIYNFQIKLQITIPHFHKECGHV